MDYARPLDIERIRRLNSPGYVRTRLSVIYTMIFAFAATVGALLRELAVSAMSEDRLNAILRLFLPAAAEKFDYRLLYEIIYNSVDIFKISFIILLAGFTYISSFVNRAAVFVTGMFYGLSAAVCIDSLLNGYYQNASAVLLINITLLRFLMLASVVVFSAVVSECYADLWSRFRTAAPLLRSWEFWKYIIKLLVLFGYVILNDTVFRFLLKLFCRG